jgi:hypothetical protein
MSQKRTKKATPPGKAGAPPAPPLVPSPAQVAVIVSLISGATATEAAARAGVRREAISRWRRDDVAFIAAYNSAIAEQRDAARAELRSLVKDAVATIRDVMTDKNSPAAARLAAARQVLDSSDGIGAIGPDDCDPVKLLAHRLETERTWREFRATFPGQIAPIVMPNWTPLLPPGPAGSNGAGQQTAAQVARETADLLREIAARYPERAEQSLELAAERDDLSG